MYLPPRNQLITLHDLGLVLLLLCGLAITKFALTRDSAARAPSDACTRTATSPAPIPNRQVLPPWSNQRATTTPLGQPPVRVQCVPSTEAAP